MNYIKILRFIKRKQLKNLVKNQLKYEIDYKKKLTNYLFIIYILLYIKNVGKKKRKR